MDIGTAFLNADALLSSNEAIVVAPPKILFDLQVIPPNTFWLVQKALYGLPTSPRAWSLHRDTRCKNLKVQWNAETFHLEQYQSDEQAWKIVGPGGS